MHQAAELELSVAPDALAVKTGKQGGRRSTVETLVVIEHSDFQMPSFPRAMDHEQS